MINYFPSFYPDELLYSLFSRYYVRSGYLAYVFAAKDLYLSKNTRPDIEFLNRLNSETKDVLTQNIPFEKVVLEHTMFPYYGRFINKERRIKAYSALVNMDNNYNNYLYIPKNKRGNRHLRYCILCADEDREKYGETYWHRCHQMIGVNICPIHFCGLFESPVIISSKTSPCLVSAEEIIGNNNSVVYYKNEIECKIAKYVFNIFASNIDINSSINIGDFLHSKLAYSKYVSLRGEQRNISLLLNDFCDYYKELSNVTINEQWQLQKIFNNRRFNMYEICLLSMFLNISEKELIDMKMPKKTQQELFDEKIILLHNQGLKYSEIAKRLNASYDVVKTIGEGKYGYYHYQLKKPEKGGARKKDWNTLDKKYLPLVKDLISKLNGSSDNKPLKITVGTVERLLELPKKSLVNCHECYNEILKHYISQEEYWAKKVVWAVKKIQGENRVVNWKNISDLTHMRKCNMAACIPFLKNYAGEDIIFQLENMV